MDHHGFRGQKDPISFNLYLWIAVGAVIGFLAGSLTQQGTKTTRVEEILVGIFGAFAGGEFLATQIRGATAPAGFSMLALGLGIAGAIAMVLLLFAMRKAVGPLKHSKSRAGDRH